MDSGSADSPAESVGYRPIHEKGFPDHVRRRKLPPTTGIKTVERVVAHDHVVRRAHNINRLFVRKVRRESRLTQLVRNELVHVTGELTLARRQFWIKGIDILEMR